MTAFAHPQRLSVTSHGSSCLVQKPRIPQLDLICPLLIAGDGFLDATFALGVRPFRRLKPGWQAETEKRYAFCSLGDILMPPSFLGDRSCFSECPVLRRLALLSLGHPLGAFPAPCGNFAALLFRFLPQEISRAKTARLRPSSGEISCGYLPEKRHSPLGAGHTRVALRGVSRVRFGQFRFGGKENGTLRKQHPA